MALDQETQGSSLHQPRNRLRLQSNFLPQALRHRKKLSPVSSNTAHKTFFPLILVAVGDNTGNASFVVRQIFTRQKGQVKKRSASSNVMGAPHCVQRCSTVHEPPIIVRVFHHIDCNKPTTKGSPLRNGSISLLWFPSRFLAATGAKRARAGSFRTLDTG